jgi:hypothetical protein
MRLRTLLHLMAVLRLSAAIRLLGRIAQSVYRLATGWTGWDFPHLSRPASCTMNTGSFPGAKSGRGVTLTPHPLLVPWSWKVRAIPLLPLWAVRPVQSLCACTRVTFTFTLYVCSPWHGQGQRYIFLHLHKALNYVGKQKVPHITVANVSWIQVALNLFPRIFLFSPLLPSTVIPRVTKIIRSGITFVSRNVMLSGVSLLAVSNVNNPVGLVGLPYVMWSAHFFVTHTHTHAHTHTHTQTEKISSYNGLTVHVCCFMLARVSTKTFVSRIHIR